MGNSVQHEVFDEARIDRYINNKLDDADKAAFETEMMEDPALLHEVQLLDALKQNLISAPAIVTRPETAVILHFKAWLRQPMSLAASLLVAVLGLNAVNQGVFNELSRDGSIPIGSVVLLEENRGNTNATFTGAPPYLFQIDVGFGNQVDDFNVTVHNQTDNAAVVQLDGLQADPDGWVRMVLDTPLMGDYEVVLDWMDGAGVEQVRRFPISISR